LLEQGGIVKKISFIHIFCMCTFIILNMRSETMAKADNNKDLVKRLKLTITYYSPERNDEGEITSLNLKAKIKNISKKETSFYFEKCPICFWEVSVNRNKFLPLKLAFHVAMCTPKNLKTLKPGESVSMELGKFESFRFHGATVKTLKLRYLLNRNPRTFIESNELKLN